jgi:methionyl-tRNA synthetase
MLDSKKYYITTPIYYVNARPHVGTAYATICADALARYHRLIGDEVYFLTGTDENAQKNVEAATAASQPVQDYVDQMSAAWQETWDELGISNNDFIRTTETRHLEGVAKFWRAVEAAGDIYKGQYEGLYCVGCEAFYRESDLIDGLCPIHQRAPEILKEENYFFRVTKYKEAVLKYIEEHPDFIEPSSRRHELINYITDHLTDTSISRPNKGWGIPVPGDDSQVIYVWFDALINYLTAVGYASDDEKFTKWWPANLHVVGKDIIKFHGSLWPAMLMSAGLSLPAKVFAHGFFTIDGQKISKSLGNAIDPRELALTYGLDALRFFLLREITFGGDGDFSIERVSARYDADLASGLGNTVSRIITLAADQNNLVAGEDLKEDFTKIWHDYHAAWQDNQPSAALDAVWRALKVCDQYIDKTEPWHLKKDPAKLAEANLVLGGLTEALRHISLMLIPLLPEAADKIAETIGSSGDKARSLTEATIWGNQEPILKVKKINPLFPRLI